MPEAAVAEAVQCATASRVRSRTKARRYSLVVWAVVVVVAVQRLVIVVAPTRATIHARADQLLHSSLALVQQPIVVMSPSVPGPQNRVSPVQLDVHRHVMHTPNYSPTMRMSIVCVQLPNDAICDIAK